MKKSIIIHHNNGQPMTDVLKLSRNALCRCGSNVKYKRCCWGEDQRHVLTLKK